MFWSLDGGDGLPVSYCKHLATKAEGPAIVAMQVYVVP